MATFISGALVRPLDIVDVPRESLPLAESSPISLIKCKSFSFGLKQKENQVIKLFKY